MLTRRTLGRENMNGESDGSFINSSPFLTFSKGGLTTSAVSTLFVGGW